MSAAGRTKVGSRTATYGIHIDVRGRRRTGIGRCSLSLTALSSSHDSFSLVVKFSLQWRGGPCARFPQSGGSGHLQVGCKGKADPISASRWLGGMVEVLSVVTVPVSTFKLFSSFKDSIFHS